MGAGFLVLLPLLGCHPRPVAHPTPIGPDLGQHHPLRGRIWDARAAQFITESTLLREVAGHRFVLLGEKHDNPLHHQIQARLLRAVTSAGRRPAVVWEMITDEEQTALSAFHAHPSRLGAALRWEQRGWPAWSMYQPIASIALMEQLPMVAGGLDRRALMMTFHAPTSLPSRLPQWTALPPPARRDIEQVIVASHCSHAMGRMVGMMVRAQLLRDAHMARRLLGHATADGTVLIAGNGHVQRDRGVPFQLAAMKPGADTFSIGVLEVQTSTDPARYASGCPGCASPAFDRVWFTRRVDNDDPCAAFRRLRPTRTRRDKNP